MLKKPWSSHIQGSKVAAVAVFYHQRILAICDSNCSFGKAPISVSMILPFFTRNIVGTLEMEYLEPIPEFSSTFSLAIFNRPLYFAASSSRIGPTARQGPHQGAQQSTSTWSFEPKTSRSKVLSETLTGRLNISMGNTLLHFPHFGLSSIRDTGTLFFAPHFEHTNIKLLSFI